MRILVDTIFLGKYWLLQVVAGKWLIKEAGSLNLFTFDEWGAANAGLGDGEQLFNVLPPGPVTPQRRRAAITEDQVVGNSEHCTRAPPSPPILTFRYQTLIHEAEKIRIIRLIRLYRHSWWPPPHSWFSTVCVGDNEQSRWCHLSNKYYFSGT